MSDSSSNPFIGNPFAQGVDKQNRTPPPPATPPAPPASQRSQPGLDKSTTGKTSHYRTQQPTNGYSAGTATPANSPATSYPSAQPPPSSASTRSTRNSVKPSSPSTAAATTKGTGSRNSASGNTNNTSPAKTTKQTPKKLRRSRSQANAAAPSTTPPAPPPAYSGSGYKVQVLAKIPLSTNTNLPSRDYLWFAVYPIIPRVGDCIFNNGMYFRVDAVFLYENTAPGWCADIEVSYYPRRR